MDGQSQKKVFVVIGSEGSYDDRRTWLVAAHLREADANQHAQNANERAREIINLHGRWNIPAHVYNKWDTSAGYVHAGRYSVEPVALL